MQMRSWIDPLQSPQHTWLGRKPSVSAHRLKDTRKLLEDGGCYRVTCSFILDTCSGNELGGNSFSTQVLSVSFLFDTRDRGT